MQMKLLLFHSLVWLLLAIQWWGRNNTLIINTSFKMGEIGIIWIKSLNCYWAHVARLPTWGVGNFFEGSLVLFPKSGSVVHCSFRPLDLLSELLALSFAISFLFHRKWPCCSWIAFSVCFLPVESWGAREGFSFWSVSVPNRPNNTVCPQNF